MKRYRICFFIFVAATLVCLAAGFFLTRAQRQRQEEIRQESLQRVPVQTEAPTWAAASQEKVVPETEPETTQPEKAYYLVSEDGFLLVFARDKKTICLYTHIPITDFPLKEQERLREGIWFADMMDIFHYLESYTS